MQNASEAHRQSRHNVERETKKKTELTPKRRVSQQVDLLKITGHMIKSKIGSKDLLIKDETVYVVIYFLEVRKSRRSSS